MKINLQNYTKDRPVWMLFEFNKKQIGVVWDSYHKQLCYMDHDLKYVARVRQNLNIEVTYL